MKFEKYQNMIMDRAHKVSAKYHVDFDECVSIGYEVYVNALKTYNASKGASFGTYLYIELNRIADEAKRTVKYATTSFSDMSGDDGYFEDTIEDYETPDNEILFEQAKKELSYEAFRLFKWVCSFEWQNWDKQRVATVPTKKMAIKGCGFSRDVVESAWNECESFWNRIGVAA